jgi:hypothetical protein
MQNSDVPSRSAWTGRGRTEILIAAAAFAVPCVVAASVRTLFVMPDDNACRASIIAMTQGHFLTLSTPQAHAVVKQMASYDNRQPFAPKRAAIRRDGERDTGVMGPASDRAVDQQKDPGYPFLAAPFQAFRWPAGPRDRPASSARLPQPGKSA